MTHAPLASKQQEFARGLPAADRATLLVYNVVKLLIPMACLTHPTEWFIPPSRGPYLWLPLSCATMLAMQVMRILASQIDQEYLVGMRAMFNAMDTPGGCQMIKLFVAMSTPQDSKSTRAQARRSAVAAHGGWHS